MLNLDSLLAGLPRMRLEPFCIARIDCAIGGGDPHESGRCIELFEPPASLAVPTIEPQGALTTLLRLGGHPADQAADRARASIARMAADWPDVQWVHALAPFDPNSPALVPVPDFLRWLRCERQRVGHAAGQPWLEASGYAQRALEDGLVPLRMLEQLERLSDAVTHAPIFWNPDSTDSRCALTHLPALPAAGAPASMVESLCDVPWTWVDDGAQGHVDAAPFLCWLEAILPIAQQLEAALGQPVYERGDPREETDGEFDDAAHRFLVLHWCCTRMPASPYVRYLMALAGAPDVESLKAALIAPENYQHPFSLSDRCNNEKPMRRDFRFHFAPVSKRVTVVFLTRQARDTAQAVLRRHAGAEVLLIAPHALMPEDWLARVTSQCEDVVRQFSVSPVYDDALEILSLTDVLYVIADHPPTADAPDLSLANGLGELLWMAYTYGIEASCLTGNGLEAMDPRPQLERDGVPAQAAQARAAARDDMCALPELRLDNDFGSTGLWNERGHCMPYSSLDLPFELVRRIAAWQRDYDRTMEPPHDMGDPAWWAAHEQEARGIARALQAAVGSGTIVKVRATDAWQAIGEVDR